MQRVIPGQAVMRINVSGQVNDEVSVNGRFVSEMDFKDSDDKDTTMDRIFALWKPNDATHVSIGRQGVALGPDRCFPGMKTAFMTAFPQAGTMVPSASKQATAT
jgi:hypothetical protein